MLKSVMVMLTQVMDDHEANYKKSFLYNSGRIDILLARKTLISSKIIFLPFPLFFGICFISVRTSVNINIENFPFG